MRDDQGQDVQEFCLRKQTTKEKGSKPDKHFLNPNIFNWDWTIVKMISYRLKILAATEVDGKVAAISITTKGFLLKAIVCKHE